MQNSFVPPIYDVVAMAVVIIFAFRGMGKGFARSVLDFAAYFVSLFGAYFVSSKGAVLIYALMLKGSITKAVAGALEKVDTAAGLDAVYGEMPSFLSRLVQEYGQGVSLSHISRDSATLLAEAIEQSVIAPVVTMLIQIILFIVVFAVLSFLTKRISKILCGFFGLPVLSTFNKLAGLVLGIATSVVFLYLAVTVMQLVLMLLGDMPPYFSRQVLDYTLLKKVFDAINNMLLDPSTMAYVQKLLPQI